MVRRRWHKHKVPLIGITGIHGSGKTELLKALERLGAITVASEDLLDTALDDTETVNELRGRLGTDIVPNGRVNRLRLGDVLKVESEKSEWLEDKLQKKLVAQIDEWRSSHEREEKQPPLAVVESTLLFELGIQCDFNKTIAVVANEETCKRRSRVNGKNGHVHFELPLLRQGEKASRSDFVIRNEGSLVDLQAGVSELWGKVANEVDKPATGPRSFFTGGKKWIVGGVALVVAASAASLLFNGGNSDQTGKEKAKVLPLKFERHIQREARKRNLSPALLAAIILRESEFDAKAEYKGAIGLMQIEPETAIAADRRSDLSLDGVKSLTSPSVNISIGSYYLRYLLSLYDENRLLALAAYNAGHSRVDRWLEDAQNEGREIAKVTDIPLRQTQQYVDKVLSADRYYEKKFKEISTVRSKQ